MEEKRLSAPGVTIITCSNHPDFLMNILRNYERQLYKRKELIIIINKDSISLKEWRQKAAAFPNVTVYKISEKVSLGQCLNCGILKAKYPIIAKFDNDDYYSPYYLREQVKALLRSGSEVVGKHACFVYLAASKRVLLRSPLEMNKQVAFVQGGTILFRKRIVKRVRFSDISLGEDVQFLRDCAAKGYTILATSPYNYVYIRRKDKSSHTWQVNDQRMIEGSLVIGETSDFRKIAVKEH